MNRNEFEKYINENYDVVSDFPWERFPNYMVFRHSDNKKWFAVVMRIPKAKVGLKETGDIDVVNLKCEPLMIGSLCLEKGFFPAYHMQKNKWISVALDGSAPDDTIKMLVDISFELTMTKIKKRRKKVLD